MGREIRRVPPNWKHPKSEDFQRRMHDSDSYQPMRDSLFSDAAAEWKTEFIKWEAGERPDYCTDEDKTTEYWEWNGGPPDRKYYRTYSDEEATWFQLYETVSEGTPVSPPFATLDELRDYLAVNGDFWDQKRMKEGRQRPAAWGMEAATAFCKTGWAPSMMVINNPGQPVQIVESKDIPLVTQKKD